mmetsp:Transcript_30974/g.55460  ORF Transcript_30974/g.55460 Transcript_30974/m.55460 type:complete len:215 (-) Transcript_30974:51-695(-)
MFCSRSQHFTSQSSEALKRYGCLSEMATARTVLMWPVRDSFSVPLARSQILISLSFPEEANHSLVGSTATVLTQPSWPDMTRISFHGGCQIGFGMSGRSRSGLTWICVFGSTGALGTSGMTGPGAGASEAAEAALPLVPMSVSICVIAVGCASLVASSIAFGWRKGSAKSASPENSSGTSRTISYSSFIFIRSIISVPFWSSALFRSSFPAKMS